MRGKIRILIDSLEITGEIDFKLNPKTAEAIWRSLPLESKVNLWGKEIYFEVPVQIEEENSQEVVEVGSIAYWPEGRCICIFFGPTPISKAGEPKAYSPVNVFGKILGNIQLLERVKEGGKIRLEKL